MRWIAFLCWAVAAERAVACSFCAGLPTDRLPLREQFAAATLVAVGTLSDASINSDGTGGVTTFTLTRSLKSNAPLPARFSISRYIPPPTDGPTTFALFADQIAQPLNLRHGEFVSEAVLQYLVESARLPTDTPSRLAFAFKNLTHPDVGVQADAFLEFARAADEDVLAARAILDPVQLKKLLTDPNTPIERHGVFAVLLGLCARPADVDFLHTTLTAEELARPVQENLGGYLSALALADPTRGWHVLQSLLVNPEKSYADRLSAVSAVRFLHTTHPEHRPHAVSCFRAGLQCADLADIAADDLRRWHAWDACPDVLAVADRPSHAGRLVRRALIRFAVDCPTTTAKTFVNRVRQTDPRLVEAIEALPAH